MIHALRNTYYKILNAVIILQLMSLYVHCQNDYPPDAGFHEELLLETDRTLYLSGESIYFNADFIGIEPISKIIYVEITNQQEIIAHGKYLIHDRNSHGRLDLPEEIISGQYVLRAYTQYMTNFPVESIPFIPLTIINPLQPLVQNQTGKMEQPLTKLTYINTSSGLEVNGKICFPPDINPYELNSWISDSANSLVCQVLVLENGLGAFEFSPNDSLYQLNWVRGIDTLQSPLSLSQIPNWMVACESKENQLCITVSNPQYQSPKFFILSIMKGKNDILFDTLLSFKNTKQLRIEYNFPYGLYNIVVSNPDQNILYERLYWHQNQNIIFDNDQMSAGTREKIKVGKKINKSSDIRSLSIGLKGTQAQMVLLPRMIVYNPLLLTTYLKNKPVLTEDILDQIQDLLLLHNEEVKLMAFANSDEEVTVLPEIRGVSLKGKVSDQSTLAGIPDIEIIASVLKDTLQLHMSQTDENGNFIFSFHPMVGMRDLYIGFRDYYPDYKIQLYNLNLEQFHSYLQVPIFYDEQKIKLIEALYINKQLTPKPGTIEEAFTNILPSTFSNPNIIVQLDQYIDLGTLQEVFNEIIPYVRVKKTTEGFEFNIFDKELNRTLRNPLILIDNLPVSNINSLLHVHPTKLNSIKVYDQQYLLGNSLLEGIVIIETKTNNFGGMFLSEEGVFIEFPFIKNMDKSYIPVPPSNIHKPFFRTTLLWDCHDVETTYYYSSDLSAKYEILSRYIDKDGGIYYQIQALEIIPDNDEI